MKLLALLLCAGAVLAAPSDLSSLEHHHDHHEHEEAAAAPAAEPYVEPAGPPRPYSFTYQAGRYPGHVDRTHSEARGEDGVVVGSFEYLGPLGRPLKVDYTADEYGFYPNVQGAAVPSPQKESAAVVRARDKFFSDSERIAAEYARIAEEHARLRAENERLRAAQEAQQDSYQ